MKDQLQSEAFESAIIFFVEVYLLLAAQPLLFHLSKQYKIDIVSILIPLFSVIVLTSTSFLLDIGYRSLGVYEFLDRLKNADFFVWFQMIEIFLLLVSMVFWLFGSEQSKAKLDHFLHKIYSFLTAPAQVVLKHLVY